MQSDIRYLPGTCRCCQVDPLLIKVGTYHSCQAAKLPRTETQECRAQLLGQLEAHFGASHGASPGPAGGSGFFLWSPRVGQGVPANGSRFVLAAANQGRCQLRLLCQTGTCGTRMPCRLARENCISFFRDVGGMKQFWVRLGAGVVCEFRTPDLER